MDSKVMLGYVAPVHALPLSGNGLKYYSTKMWMTLYGAVRERKMAPNHATGNFVRSA